MKSLTLTKEEMEAFKSMKYPWMEDRFVSPMCITFKENMFGDEYCVVKKRYSSHDIGFMFTFDYSADKEYEEIFEEYYGIGRDINDAFMGFEHEIFAMACLSKADLSKIPMEYIMDSANRNRKHTNLAINTLIALKSREES